MILHRSFRQIGKHGRGTGDVALLSGRQLYPDRPPLLIDERMDFGREPTAGATQTSISTPLDRLLIGRHLGGRAAAYRFAPGTQSTSPPPPSPALRLR